MTFWTGERDEAIKRHLGEGLSHAETAAAVNFQFHTDYSRNAVIGRANRIGIRSLCQPHHGNGMRKVKPKPSPNFRPKPRLPKPVFACDDAGHRVAEVAPLNLPLLELEPGMCRWPYGDGPYVFCAHQVNGEASYCEPHMALSLRADTYRGGE
jgi:GcrA cell cycle regulator